MDKLILEEQDDGTYQLCIEHESGGTTMGVMTLEVYERLGDDSDIEQFIAITVDPEDFPAAIKLIQNGRITVLEVKVSE